MEKSKSRKALHFRVSFLASVICGKKVGACSQRSASKREGHRNRFIEREGNGAKPTLRHLLINLSKMP